MVENMHEGISEWWNDDFDLMLAREVDEYEQQSRFASVSNEDIDNILKIHIQSQHEDIQNGSLSCLKVRILALLYAKKLKLTISVPAII